MERCDKKNHLELNVNMTEGMVVTCSNKRRELAAAVITTVHGKPIEIAEEYKYLGTIFDNLLQIASDTEEILRKGHQ